MPAAYERRKNARSSSCDLTASRRLQVGAKRGVEGRELAEPLPHRRRGRQGRLRRRRRVRRRPRRTAAAACRRWRAPAASRRAPRPRPAAGATRSISASWNARNSARDAFCRSLASRRSRSAWTLLPACANAAATDAALGADAGERVEQVEVGRRIEQHLVLVLAVQIDQAAGRARAARRRSPGRRRRRRGCGPARRSPAAACTSWPSGVSKTPGRPRCPPRSGRGRRRRARRRAGRQRRRGWTCRRRSRPSGR